MIEKHPAKGITSCCNAGTCTSCTAEMTKQLKLFISNTYKIGGECTLNFKSNLFDKKKKDTIRISHYEQDAVDRVAHELFASLPSALHNRPIVFVCIGTDRSTGDSLGPLIGSLLVEKNI